MGKVPDQVPTRCLETRTPHPTPCTQALQENPSPNSRRFTISDLSYLHPNEKINETSQSPSPSLSRIPPCISGSPLPPSRPTTQLQGRRSQPLLSNTCTVTHAEACSISSTGISHLAPTQRLVPPLIRTPVLAAGRVLAALDARLEQGADFLGALGGARL